MPKRQLGFTLVEIAIVLVIIGLLLGGILKGQELVDSAKVKSLANDFRTIPTYVYGYQDKFRALPGDDSNPSAHVGGTKATTNGTQGNGIVEGAWDSTTATDESALFWQHVRLANLASGPTDVTAAGYYPTNSTGGRIGISSATDSLVQIDSSGTNPMKGSYQFCSKGILGKFVKQLDIQVDDGNTASGSLRAQVDGATKGSASTATASINDATGYTVCMTF